MFTGGYNSGQRKFFIGRTWRGWNYSGVQSTELTTHKLVIFLLISVIWVAYSIYWWNLYVICQCLVNPTVLVFMFTWFRSMHELAYNVDFGILIESYMSSFSIELMYFLIVWYVRVYPPGGFVNFLQRPQYPLQPQVQGENFHFVGQTMGFNPISPPPPPPPPSAYGAARSQVVNIDIDEEDNSRPAIRKRYWTHEEEERLVIT